MLFVICRRVPFAPFLGGFLAPCCGAPCVCPLGGLLSLALPPRSLVPFSLGSLGRRGSLPFLGPCGPPVADFIVSMLSLPASAVVSTARYVGPLRSELGSAAFNISCGGGVGFLVVCGRRGPRSGVAPSHIRLATGWFGTRGGGDPSHMRLPGVGCFFGPPRGGLVPAVVLVGHCACLRVSLFRVGPWGWAGVW